MKKEYLKSRILALVLTIAALAVGQTVRADQTWSVTYETYSVENNRYATFTVTRTETGAAETVKYRTVSLTALAGKYFEEKSGDLTFAANESSKTVVVHEQDPGDADLIYNYWTYDVQYRSYRFEVLDNTNSTELAHCDRPITHGIEYNVDATKLFQNKEITAFTDEKTVDDAASGFGQASYVINPKDEGYYASADAPKAYLTKTGMKLAMTFDFQAKEKEDGYQYFQVLVDDETNYDSGNNAGDVGEINYAHFLAGFGHDPGKKNTHYAKYAFPVPDAANIAKGDYDDKWLSYGNTVGRLYSQKTKSDCWHEASGRLLADPSLQKIIVRFDATGKHDDTWYVKDFKANIQVIDEQNPTVITADVRLSPGPYVEGSTFYVSVPFSEIVVVPTNAKPTITTNWGNLTYDMGSGTNVLVFKGTIGSGLNPTAQLQITGLSGGPVRDLWGNPFVGDNVINVTFQAQTVPPNWTGTGTEADPYIISNKTGLDMLYQCVNERGTEFGPDVTHPDGYFFKLGEDIKYNWNTSNTPNYNAIGTQDHPFRGHFDGDGFTVSNIIIVANPSYQGLFGYVGAGGTVKNVTVANSDIRVNYPGSDYAAGIVGCCAGGSVSGCFVYNTTIKSIGTHYGPVVGNDDATQEHNYYFRCTVQDQTVQNVFSITVDEGVTVSSPVKTYSGTGYFLENAHVRLFAPIGKAFASITVTRNSDQSDVTDDVLSGTTIIMPAYDITVSSPLVDVWGVTHGADGSEDKPYIISTAAGWDALAAAVNRGEHYYDKFFKLSDDFDNSATPITTMAGWGHVFFSGTFLGNGRTLTVNLDNRTEEEGCAPFFRTVGATIKNLRVAGTITTDNKMAAGIVSHMKRTTLEGCVSSVTIISSVSGDGTHGGVVGVIESGAGNSDVRGCVFDGVICCTAANLTHSCGGIAGWKEVGTNWLDCLYAPAAIPEGKYALDMTNCSTFARIEGTFYANSYYTESLGGVQNGNLVYPLDTKPANNYGDVLDDYGLVKTYYKNCIEYNGKFYVHPETCTLNESGNYSTAVVNGYFANITLDGRTLHKDGAWNTLCLPFDVTAAQIAASDLAGADIRTLSSASFENSTLTLNFTAQGAVTSIQAGVPYIIKWASGTDVVSPTIDAVIIDNTAHDVTCDLGDGKSIVFKGTKSATTFTEDDNTKLFVGTGNKLHYPLTGASINAQRAYFQLNGLTAGNASSGAPNLNIVLNFGDDATSIRSLSPDPSPSREGSEYWYDMSGRKLSQQPTQKGVYIHGGHKVVLK